MVAVDIDQQARLSQDLHSLVEELKALQHCNHTISKLGAHLTNISAPSEVRDVPDGELIKLSTMQYHPSWSQRARCKIVQVMATMNQWLLD